MDITKDRRSAEVIVAEHRRRDFWILRVKVLLFLLSIPGFTALWIWTISGHHFGVSGGYGYDAWLIITPLSTFLWWFGCGAIYNENKDWPIPNVCWFPDPLFIFGPFSLLVLIILHWKDKY